MAMRSKDLTVSVYCCHLKTHIAVLDSLHIYIMHKCREHTSSVHH